MCDVSLNPSADIDTKTLCYVVEEESSILGHLGIMGCRGQPGTNKVVLDFHGRGELLSQKSHPFTPNNCPLYLMDTNGLSYLNQIHILHVCYDLINGGREVPDRQEVVNG